MRKKLWLIFSLNIFYLGICEAQSPQFKVLYTNSSSGIVFEQQGQSQKRVFPGLTLPSTGSMVFEAGKWADLMYNGKKKRLQGPASYDMAQLANSMKSEKKSTFLSRFWKFVNNSVSPSDNTSQLEKYHKEYLTNARAGISGFGDAKYAIKIPLYFSELIADAHLKFYWDSIPVRNGYIFEITSRETEQVIFKAITKSNTLSLNLDELNLDPSEVYEWMVKAVKPAGELAVSPISYFSFVPNEVADLIQEIKTDDDYQDLEDYEKDMFLLYNLEEEGAYHTAYLTYQKLINENPDNKLNQQLFASFLARMNALDEAIRTIKAGK